MCSFREMLNCNWGDWFELGMTRMTMPCPERAECLPVFITLQVQAFLEKRPRRSWAIWEKQKRTLSTTLQKGPAFSQKTRALSHLACWCAARMLSCCVVWGAVQISKMAVTVELWHWRSLQAPQMRKHVCATWGKLHNMIFVYIFELNDSCTGTDSCGDLRSGGSHKLLSELCAELPSAVILLAMCQALLYKMFIHNGLGSV